MTTTSIAYFSMEIALDSAIPTYSGGLGVLAGDTLRSAADLGLPLIAVTLLHRKGYFRQSLDRDGSQREQPADWRPEEVLDPCEPVVRVAIEGRNVHVRAWRYEIEGCGDTRVPVLLLDTDVSENAQWDRRLTDLLYGGDDHYRLCQEIVLGIGGVRMLRALGHRSITRFHMNEGHSSLLALELLDEQSRTRGRLAFNHEDVEAVRAQCVFTTHTPVAAGHDQFPLDMVTRVLQRPEILNNREVFCCEGVLNLTYLALNVSHYVNGVAKRHGEVSRELLKPRRNDRHYEIDSITNGVHLGSWVSRPFAQLFDRVCPGWREDNYSLRSVLSVAADEIWEAHQSAKRELLAEVASQTGCELDVDALTIGFARRATAYKRADLIFDEIERLKRIERPLQFVFAGKAHPRDEPGKALIRRIVAAGAELAPKVRVVYLPDYDMRLARLVIAGVDVWLNTPEPPLEASGTSGMKAAANAVPSLSVLDGWWIEGCIEGVTGWAIGSLASTASRESDTCALYDKLEYAVVRTFYEDRAKFIRMMQHAIALNASFFNTQRMVQQYAVKAYLL